MSKRAVKIPRGTCTLFGAIKAISTIKRSAVLVHGPKGCVYQINYILGMRGDRPSEVYSTCLDEHDVIFGAEDTLTAAIEELDAELCPDLICVLSCCASSIIGEDLESAIRSARTQAKVIGIESGGFEGDHRTGYSETLKRLVIEFAVPSGITIPGSVNLVGVLRGGPDLHELRRLLGSIGVSVNAVLTAETSLSEMQRLGSAALSIVLCEPAGREAAEEIERRCGVPYIIEDLPMGYAPTFRFLERVGDAIGVPVPKKTHCAELPSLRGRRIALISGPTRAVSMTRFLQELDLLPVLIVVDHASPVLERLDMLVDSTCEVLVEPEQELIMQRLQERGVDLILGGMLERPMAAALGIEHLDVMHGSQKTIGIEGADTLIQLFARMKEKGT